MSVADSMNLNGGEWKNKGGTKLRFHLRNCPKNGQSGHKRMDMLTNEIAFHGPLCEPLKPKFRFSIEFVGL